MSRYSQIMDKEVEKASNLAGYCNRNPVFLIGRAVERHSGNAL
jgi:hypothetical protein